MSSEIAINVENLSKCYRLYDRPRDRIMQLLARGGRRYYKEFWALKNISFEIKKGETVGLVGRNGSGKSTLLQMICGTLNPTTGVVHTRGRIAALLELGSGFNPEFSGRENVYMNAALLGLTKAETDACFDNILAFADIGDFINRPVKTYSSGMTVRLAFAVQAMVEPDILIIDEALAVGDEKFQRKCFSRIDELKNKGTSIIFVSHSESQIIQLCDRALLLDNGNKLIYENPTSVIRAYQKLIYAPSKLREHLLEEYASGSELKESGLGSETQHLPLSDHPSLFDPDLIPQTTTESVAHGAVIHKIQILDMEGQNVNLLKLGGQYQFVVSGQFSNSIEDVYFGVHIRNIAGVVITGQRYPENGSQIKRVEEDSKFHISFSFNMILMPGVYFVGAGIWSSQEPNCRHRIIDATMFRLLDDQQCNSFGYVVASCGVPKIELFR